VSKRVQTDCFRVVSSRYRQAPHSKKKPRLLPSRRRPRHAQAQQGRTVCNPCSGATRESLRRPHARTCHSRDRVARQQQGGACSHRPGYRGHKASVPPIDIGDLLASDAQRQYGGTVPGVPAEDRQAASGRSIMLTGQCRTAESTGS
jgi:hypothetical protein